MSHPAGTGAGPGPRRSQWLSRRAGVRARLTVVAVVVAAVTVVVAGLVLVLLLGRSLDDAANTAATQRAHEVAGILARQGPAGVQRVLAGAAAGESTITQVVGSGGRVLASSPQIAGEGPLADLRAAAGETRRERVDTLPVGDGIEYLVVSMGVSREGGIDQVVVAQSLTATSSSVRSVVSLLLVGLPLLALAAGFAAYVFVGRALRPVEAMRRQVSEITATDLAMRVQVPLSGDEVHHLARTMNEMLARLQAAQEGQRRFVADASHELRSPLATVKANLQLTGAQPDPDTWPEARATMLDETERLERIISDLLLLASADDGSSDGPSEDVDLEELVFDEVEHLRRSTSLEVRAQVAPVRCHGNRHQLSQVLRNLADNAGAHARTRVDISLSRAADVAVLDVSDDGPGIPAQDRARVFERFERLDGGRGRDSGGAGLGLAIVRDLVRAHSGDVELGESPSGGARFRVTLPAQP